MKPQDTIYLRAAALARSSPVEWENFLAEFQHQVSSARELCITAAPDVVQLAQGRAQALSAFYDLMKNCTKTASQLESKIK